MGLVRALLYIGKKPKTIISDNLKVELKGQMSMKQRINQVAQEATDTTNFR